MPSWFQPINRAYIDQLLADRLPEGTEVDYKENVELGVPAARIEFCEDVTAFANARGGDLVIGVREAQGAPTDAPGIQVVDPEALQQRLLNIIRDNIEPRLGVRIEIIPGFTNGSVVVVRVPRGWRGPYRARGRDRFVVRSGPQKQTMNLDDLREAFRYGEGAAIRARRFRDERIGRLLGDDAPVHLYPGARVLLHCVPLLGDIQVDLGRLEGAEVQPMRWSNGAANLFSRYNLDGRLYYWQTLPDGFVSYFQAFRDGSMEDVDAFTVREEDGRRLLRELRVGTEIIATVLRRFAALRRLGIPPPVVLMISVIGARGFESADEDDEPAIDAGHEPVIDRDIVVLPDVVIEDFDRPPDTELKPAFDVLWQAAGRPQCPYFADAGDGRLRWSRTGR